MNSINLLPRKPLLNQLFIPLLFAILLFHFIITVSFIYVYVQTALSEPDRQAQIASANQRIQQLSALQQQDKLTQDFQLYSSEIQKLESARHNWTAILNVITAALPPISRIQSIAADDKDTVKISMQAADFTDIANYVVALKSSSLVESAIADSIIRVTKIPSISTRTSDEGELQLFAEIEQKSEGSPSWGMTSGNHVLMSQVPWMAARLVMAAVVPTPTATSKSKSEDLLNELNQIITEKENKQEPTRGSSITTPVPAQTTLLLPTPTLSSGVMSQSTPVVSSTTSSISTTLPKVSQSPSPRPSMLTPTPVKASPAAGTKSATISPTGVPVGTFTPTITPSPVIKSASSGESGVYYQVSITIKLKPFSQKK